MTYTTNILMQFLFSLDQDTRIEETHRRTRGVGGGGAAAPPKNLKLKSQPNFEHKLGKNLMNKASIRKQL